MTKGAPVHLGYELGTGKKLWSAPVSDDITSPAVVGGMILVGGDDSTVTAYGRKP